MVMTGCGFSAAVMDKPPRWRKLPKAERKLWKANHKMVSSWEGLITGLAKQLNFEIFRDRSFRWLPGLTYMLEDVIGKVSFPSSPHASSIQPRMFYWFTSVPSVASH